jgi:hypothetical protein
MELGDELCLIMGVPDEDISSILGVISLTYGCGSERMCSTEDEWKFDHLCEDQQLFD